MFESPTLARALSSGISVNRRRVSTRVLGMVALALALPIAGARAARHISLTSSVPAKDSHVMTPLKELRLTFSGRIDVSKASVELIGADSAHVALDSLQAVADSSRVAVSKLAGSLPNGTYLVRWKAVAADGAAGSGSFTFMYMAAKK